ncbi:MAG: D-alanyl-D-alanine carboxypeptidase [Clostridia bacterium]|nr:D-alanyl-D-alanine carboxypeptidase [Clostridia bacterium]
MKNILKMIVTIIVSVLLAFSVFSVEFSGEIDCKSAILMEASTGRVLYEKNADEPLPPASVTKIMTLLLIMEAIDSGKIALTDKVTVSEYAASMGGSQVFLEPGETMTVEEMIKCVVISSANDCAVALAEFLYGSEESFVGEMNKRAAELGMLNTIFENTNGLDDTASNHLISARDIAIMSRELLNHPLILNYSSTWMDSIRNGAFGLTNTNRLIRYYSGANGLKTGSTAKAKFCISATALRDNMQLIAVIMAAPTRDVRNNIAKQLLDFGFANYGLFIHKGGELEPIKVNGGTKESCKVSYQNMNITLEKEKISKITCRYVLPEYITAPIEQGQKVGEAIFEYNGEKIAQTEVYADETVSKINIIGIFFKVLAGFCLN